MSRDLFKVVRVTPGKALFHDVTQGQRPVPEWLRGEPEKRPASPAAQVALGRDRGSESTPLTPRTERPSDSQAPSAALDPLYDAKMQSESLAAAMRESWRAPPPSVEGAPTEEVLAELGDAILALELERKELLKDTESALLTLVRLVAERVIAREIDGDEEVALRLVREGLSALEESTHTQVLLGYGFAAQVPALVERLKREGVHAEIAIDETLEPYACHLRSSLGSVDESMSTRLDALLSALTGEGEA